MSPAAMRRNASRMRARGSVQPRLSNRHGGLAFAYGRPCSSMRRVSGYASTLPGIGVEQADERLQPARMPDVVIRGERPVLRRREHRRREVEGAACVAEHAEPALVPGHVHARIGGRGALRHGERRVRRAVVDQHEREVAVRLGEQGVQGLGQVPGLVEERRADDDAGGGHASSPSRWSTSRVSRTAGITPCATARRTAGRRSAPLTAGAATLLAVSSTRRRTWKATLAGT